MNAADGIIPLKDKKRQLCDRATIAKAAAILDRAFATRRVGPYLLHAAIVHTHVAAVSFGTADWRRIVALYEALHQIDPLPVTILNRALAIGERDGPAADLAAVEATASKALASYASVNGARVEILRRLGCPIEASAALRQALSHTSQPAEQRMFQVRLTNLMTEPRAPRSKCSNRYSCMRQLVRNDNGHGSWLWRHLQQWWSFIGREAGSNGGFQRGCHWFLSILVRRFGAHLADVRAVKGEGQGFD